MDKAEWHFGAADFPRGRSRRCALPHMGLFLEWAVQRGLESSLVRAHRLALWMLRRRWISGRFYLTWFWDQTFNSEYQLNSEGHSFAEGCYERYVEQYAALFASDYPTIYHVPNSGEAARRVARLLDQMFDAWRTSTR